MSTYWDVACLDCASFLDLHINHGDAICAAVVRLAPGLAGLANDLDGLGLDFGAIEVSVPGSENARLDLGWLQLHYGHILAPISEYGDIATQCNEMAMHAAGGRDGTRQCHQPKDHGGDCVFEKRDGYPYKARFAREAQRLRVQGRIR